MRGLERGLAAIGYADDPGLGRDPPRMLLGVMCAALVLIVVVLGTRLTFFNDDWWFLLQRPGLAAHPGIDVVLAPHNGNLVALVVPVYKLLVAVFGLDFQLPFRLVLGAALASVGVLIYVLVSARMGRTVGLVAAALVLFLGPAWEDLLFFASIDLIGSLAIGLGALVALERDFPRRNAIACGLVVCSVLMSNLGIAFVVPAAVAVGLRRRPRQLWIAAIPALVFAVWWIGYGSDAPSHLSAANIEHLPRYVFGSVTSGLASLTGLNRGSGAPHYVRGGIALLAGTAALAASWYKGHRPSSWVLVFASAAISFWVLTGASYFPGRDPFASRYQLIDAALLILIAAEAFRSVPLRTASLGVIAAGATLAVVSNGYALSTGYTFMREQSRYVKADLGALEIERAVAPATVWLAEPVARNPYLSGVTAGLYFTETRAHGTPPFYSPAQIRATPPLLRQAADSVLASGEMTAKPTVRARGTGNCQTLIAGSVGHSSEIDLPPRGARLTDLTADVLVIRVRRFAPADLPDPIDFLAPGKPVSVTTAPDAVSTPWRLTATGTGRYSICPQ
ncbi:MAG: hypothetical protein M3076_15185 [Actinomycetota bacterium]|nr:hypothetical protein [Actinomycetota bacterium]